MKKLAIIITHPIQYYAPVFRLLARSCQLKVFYTLGKQNDYDAGFKQAITWDIPLLEGYEYEFLANNSKNPGAHYFGGIANPLLLKRIEDFLPDAILVYGWSYKSHLKAIRHFKGKIPVWFRGDSNLLDEKPGLKKYIRHLFLKWVYKHIDKAFYVGTANKAYYVAFGLKATQLVFAPHAIDNNRFSENRQAEAKQLRESLGLKGREYLIAFAGKFEPKKDPEILLSAFIELNLSNVHLLFVGNGILEENLKDQSKKMSAERTTKSEQRTTNIHFIDFQNQSQMPAVYQACDLFCLPSKGPGETWGLAINEAMAAGKAILVTNKVGCAIDLVKNEVNGAIFEAGNRNELKNKLTSLVENPERLFEMGNQSANEIKEWTIEKQAQIIINELNATN
ncbi:MAG: glycosyltransferase family 4 protein [Bacteroidota bacterium]